MFIISPKFHHYIVIVMDIELEAVFEVVWLLLLWLLVIPVLLWLLALLALHLQLPLSVLLHPLKHQLLLYHFFPEVLQLMLVVYCLFSVQRHFVLCVSIAFCLL